jgi:hypothetical protein
MTLEEKYKLAIETLHRISNFDHADRCNSSAPIHECCCYAKSEQELAFDVLKQIGEE